MGNNFKFQISNFKSAFSSFSNLPLRLPALFLTLLLFLAGSRLLSQTVYLPVRHPVYDYLDRIEARYGIGLLQFSRPLARMEIARALDSLERGSEDISSYDREELAFYRREFAEELRRLHPGAPVTARDDRWNMVRLSAATPVNSFLAADLVGKAGYEKRQDAEDVLRRSNGIRVYGYVGDHVGAYMRWYDNGLDGVPYDKYSRRTPEQGIVKGPGKGSSYEFEIAEGQVTYSNRWLRAGIQKMDLWLGSGRYGAIILSDKAPSVPRVAIQVDITDWLRFEYFHAWLFSDSLDFERTYRPTAGGPEGKFYETKFLVSHSLTARPVANLQLTLGESIVYGGGDIDVLFLIPVISFRAADRWTRATTGNSQFFADVRYTPVSRVTLYGSAYIDEMDITKVLFTGEKENADYHVAYTIGALAVDALWPYLRLASETRIEFSRVYPFAYTNPQATQQYTSHSVYLGHWIGPNADLLSLEHIVHPARGWDVSVGAAWARFGKVDPAVPPAPRVQPAFLYGHEYSQFTLTGSLRWTPVHDLTVTVFGRYTTIDKTALYKGSPLPAGNALGAGITYGVY